MKPFALSKSKIIFGLQCEKRLWLKIHRPELEEVSEATQARFRAGNRVGEVARGLFPAGVLIGHADDPTAALAETGATLSRGTHTIFEATFSHQHVLARADILIRDEAGPRLVEVKASSEIKKVHLQDCAVQDWVMTGAGNRPGIIELATIDTTFVYGGDGNYDGLFNLKDVTSAVRELTPSVPEQVNDLAAMLARPMPDIATGAHCNKPYKCPFQRHCFEGSAEFPVAILPHGRKLIKALSREGVRDVRDIPQGRLVNELHERIRIVTIQGEPYVSSDLAAVLSALAYPRYYVDFETFNPAVPIWAGTRPYEQLPFQWSCHVETRDRPVAHDEFLDASGKAPMRSFVESLIKILGIEGPILVYTNFERKILNGLAKRFPDLAAPLEKVIERLFDLHIVLQAHYYHPQMRGSCSLKVVLPIVAPELSYENLKLVQDGGQAHQAFEELIQGEGEDTRREGLSRALLAYCGRDTFALYALTHRFLHPLRSS